MARRRRGKNKRQHRIDGKSTIPVREMRMKKKAALEMDEMKSRKKGEK